MEVKDLPISKVNIESSARAPEGKLQKSVSTLAGAKLHEVRSESVSVRVESKPRAAESQEARAKANSFINVINLAAQATAEIERLVASIDGIVEQASDEKLPEPRRAVLESEVKQLVGEIRSKASVSADNGVRPLAGDKIRLEIERQLGKTLEVILPDGSKDAFGLAQIGLSPKDTIISTRTNIAAAKETIEQLRQTIVEAKEQLNVTVQALDVAIQNSEASEASVRDVDKAIDLAGKIKIGIGHNPEAALRSVGEFNRGLLDSLEN